MAPKQPQFRMTDKWYQELLTQFQPHLEAKAKAIVESLPDDKPAGYEMRKDKHGRPVAMIALMYPRALADQAKHGRLTRAAATAGMEVNRYNQT